MKMQLSGRHPQLKLLEIKRNFFLLTVWHSSIFYVNVWFPHLMYSEVVDFFGLSVFYRQKSLLIKQNPNKHFMPHELIILHLVSSLNIVLIQQKVVNDFVVHTFNGSSISFHFNEVFHTSYETRLLLIKCFPFLLFPADTNSDGKNWWIINQERHTRIQTQWNVQTKISP